MMYYCSLLFFLEGGVGVGCVVLNASVYRTTARDDPLITQQPSGPWHKKIFLALTGIIQRIKSGLCVYKTIRSG